MKALITGMRGTVAPALAQHLARFGHSTVAWDRSMVPTDNYPAIRDFILRTKPDWFFHLAMGSPDWAEMIAKACAEERIKLLYTSTVSVFAGTQHGPFTVDVVPEPNDDYGRYKFECERRVQAACPDAIVARLGWQIGSTAGSNNMIDFLERTFKEKGRIEASRQWYPACSFLADTAEALTVLMEMYPAGLYHLDGNPGLTFYEIAESLNRLRGSPWVVAPNDDLVQDHRMFDRHIQVNPIAHRFEGAGPAQASHRNPAR